MLTTNNVIADKPESRWSNHDQDETWVKAGESPNWLVLQNRQMNYG